MSVSSSSWGLGRAAVCDCGIPWTFLLPFFQYINTLIQELGSTKTYERISTDERSIVNTHSIDITAKFVVGIKENQNKLPTLYWFPKLHNRPYKARFIANSSSCTATILCKLLTSCLSAVKNIELDTMISLRKGQN